MERLLVIIMDGIGHSQNPEGNAVLAASTPTLDYLAKHALYTTLKAHGTWVGMPHDDDLGNSEVGHNTIGAGRVFQQGAKLVDLALQDGTIFRGATWRKIATHATRSTLHFIGLLSDGNVHAHQDHLHQMITQAKTDGISRVRVHALLDGRDVAARSAEIYLERLEQHLQTLASEDFDANIATCGGRMQITMDRYEADWEMVKRGWDLHVHGKGREFTCAVEGVKTLRQEQQCDDQYLPPFKLKTSHNHVRDGDAVVFFNFRGDRAVEVAQAFTTKSFTPFNREPMPIEVMFAGLLEYDSDRKIPPLYLVSPPRFDYPLSEHLLHQQARQFACSESQKYGHVTFFWNGNHSGYLDSDFEEYVEIPSHHSIHFDDKPWMKAAEIAATTINRIADGSFDCGRINFANGDMVGHTGNFQASVLAVSVVDLMVGRILKACQQHNVKLIVTADHGNCDEMYADANRTPKTSHTLNPVPFYFYDPQRPKNAYQLAKQQNFALANVANTILTAMNLPTHDAYLPSLMVPR
ncbi:MAG: 2,3-bisphosphoglycerate-independent phosphoglycerate mutase [Pseudomonadota bacterium]|nr:2,3-bisphosphoglycerate-independent phosphoglycerate mutase [Pseudomonadota bacterium]